MKKIFNLFLFLMTTISLIGQNGENHRDINWVHGFVGNQDAWKEFDEYFSNQFDITTTRVEYPSKGGIENAAEIAEEQLISEEENPFVIAHSMGGLVTRQMYSNDDTKFTGYITFGTPHNGAYFANSYMNGDVDEYVDNFIDQVFIDVIGAIFLPKYQFIMGTIYDLLGSDDPEFFASIIFAFIESNVKESADDATIGDLQVNKPFINNLVHPDLPKINYYGKEDSPVHWRFIGSFSKLKDDTTLPDAMEYLETFYTVNYYVATATAIGCGIASFFNPTCIPVALYATQLAIQLNQAINTLQQSEAGWLALIGALEDVQEDCEYIEVVTGYDYDFDGEYNDPDDIRIRDSCLYRKYVRFEKSDTVKLVLEDMPCDSTNTEYKEDSENRKTDTISVRRPDICDDYVERIETIKSCTYIYYNGDNDGFIPANSTEESDKIAWIELLHLNHQELKSDDLSRTHLEDLFKHEGIYKYDERFKYFKLKKIIN